MSALRSSDRSIAEIARASGFVNPDYFRRFFRKRTGQTPSQFRNEA